MCVGGREEWANVMRMRLPAGALCAMLIAFSLTLIVKKKCSPGLRLSNLMNLGRKKSTSLEPPERSLETSSKNRCHLRTQGLFTGLFPRRRAWTAKAKDIS
jgi:hypothetical protein